MRSSLFSRQLRDVLTVMVHFLTQCHERQQNQRLYTAANEPTRP